MILCRDGDLGQLLYNPEVVKVRCMPSSPHGLCNRNDKLFCFADRQESHDGSASSGTRVLRFVRSLFVGAVHSWPVDLVLLLYVYSCSDSMGWP